MWKLTVVVWALFLGLLLQACAPGFSPEEDCNFVTNASGQRVSWEGRLPVVMYIDDRVPQTALPAIEKAMQVWHEQTGVEYFELGGWVSSPDGPKRDGQNIIYWMPSWERKRSSEQARTSIFWSGKTIRESDVKINAYDFRFNFSNGQPRNDEVDFTSLMVHELGHVLGRSHEVEQRTVMHTHLAKGDVRRELFNFDIEMMSCEY